MVTCAHASVAEIFQLKPSNFDFLSTLHNDTDNIVHTATIVGILSRCHPDEVAPLRASCRNSDTVPWLS